MEDASYFNNLTCKLAERGGFDPTTKEPVRRAGEDYEAAAWLLLRFPDRRHCHSFKLPEQFQRDAYSRDQWLRGQCKVDFALPKLRSIHLCFRASNTAQIYYPNLLSMDPKFAQKRENRLNMDTLESVIRSCIST